MNNYQSIDTVTMLTAATLFTLHSLIWGEHHNAAIGVIFFTVILIGHKLDKYLKINDQKSI